MVSAKIWGRFWCINYRLWQPWRNKIMVVGVLSLAPCYVGKSRYVELIRLHILVNCMELRWRQPCSDPVAPCKCEKIRAIEVLHLFRCYTHTHTHTPAHILHGLEECQQDKGNEPQRGRQWCELQCSNPFKSGKNCSTMRRLHFSILQLVTEWAKLPCGTESKTSIRHCMIYSSNRAPQANKWTKGRRRLKSARTEGAEAFLLARMFRKQLQWPIKL